MADGGARAQAFIKLDMTAADQAKQIKEAAQAAARELRHVEREIDKIVNKKGIQAVDQVLFDRRRAAKELLETNRTLLEESKRAEKALRDIGGIQSYKQHLGDERKMGAFFRKLAGAQFVRGLFTGQADPMQAARFLATPETGRALEKAGFLRLGAAATNAMPAALIGLFAANHLREAFRAVAKDEAATREFGEKIAGGKEFAALADVYYREFEKFHIRRAFDKSGSAAELAGLYSGAVRGMVAADNEAAVKEATDGAISQVIREMGFFGAGPQHGDFDKLRRAYDEFVAEKAKRESLSTTFEEMSVQDQGELAAAILSKMEFDDKTTLEKFNHHLGKVNRKNVLVKQQKQKAEEEAKTPTELFGEMELRHERRVWSGLRRTDALASLARSDMQTFVRD